MKKLKRIRAHAIGVVLAGWMAAVGTMGLSPALAATELPTTPAVPELAKQPAPADRLVRAHSPVIGAKDAPVTIVEVFDPSCEACRAWHPDVKRIVAAHPGRVRVVLRYALFHKGSEVAAALLELARMQGRYEAALEALFRRQPEWAMHGAPDLQLATRLVHEAGVDVSGRAAEAALATVRTNLQQDTADVNALLVERTPTFFVNGRQLLNATPGTLAAAVQAEVAKARPKASR